MWVFLFTSLAVAFNNPPGVEIWCGKAYQSTNASFEPGGWMERPARSDEPLLDLKIRPRMSLYTLGDGKGSLIVDSQISYIHGEPWRTTDHDSQSLNIDISIDEVQLHLTHSISVNTSSNELEFPLHGLAPRFEPYRVNLTANCQDGSRVYTATTDLYHLPERTDGGSITKLDSLYGGLLVQDYTKDSSWSPLLPYSYYVSWDGWLEKSLSNVQSFKDQGYNIIHIVPNAGLANEAFNFTELGMFLNKCDEVGLWVMYDMRWTYQNLTSVQYQVDLLKTHKSMLLWYTGDEPDGQGDPLNATRITYDLIKSLDPWHPVSLCLNCYNFYYKEYASGADIILSDVYPVAVNTSWSTVYDTVCNTTYGCCGCDECQGNMEDISTRLDIFAEYQSWVGSSPKTFWGVPMAFGNESFWTRYPTATEEVTMTMLNLNHNAKGIVMWDYPTTNELSSITSKLSKLLASDRVVRFLLGAATVPLRVTGHSKMDVSSWMVGNRMLISILALQTPSWSNAVSIELPGEASVVQEVLWGSGRWKLDNGKLVKEGGHALETDIIIVEYGT